jgi:hypothetical protein
VKVDKRQQSLFITVNQSWYLFWYLVLLHLALSILVVTLSERILLNLCLVSILWAHFAFGFSHYFWRYKTHALEISKQGEVLIHNRTQGARYSLASSYRCRWFVILYLKQTSSVRMKTVFIAFDALEKRTFHQLMLLLSDTKLYPQ